MQSLAKSQQNTRQVICISLAQGGFVRDIIHTATQLLWYRPAPRELENTRKEIVFAKMEQCNNFIHGTMWNRVNMFNNMKVFDAE